MAHDWGPCPSCGADKTGPTCSSCGTPTNPTKWEDPNRRPFPDDDDDNDKW